jgi:apolipoprotein N-acyltransferase
MLRKYIFYTAIGGILMGLSLNEVAGVPLSPLAWVCYIPLMYAFKNSTSLVSAYGYAFIFFLFCLIVGLFSFMQVYFLGGAFLILIGAMIFSIPVLPWYVIKRKSGWYLSLLAFPIMWPPYEWFLAEALFSMPILTISVTQAPMIWLNQYIDITGHSGISVWLMSVNVMLVFWIESRRTSRHDLSAPEAKNNRREWVEYWLKMQSTVRYAAIIAALFFLPLLYAGYTYRTLPSSFEGTTRVSLIQPNLNSANYVNDSTAVAALMKLVTLTDTLIANDTTDLVVWPENAVPLPFLRSEGTQKLLFAKVLEWETTLLTGTFDFHKYDQEADIPALPKYLGRDYEIFNAAIVLTPQLAWKSIADNLDIRTLSVYRKQNLMHFTERVPFSGTFPVLSRMSVFGDDGSYSAGIDNISLNYLSHDDRIIKVSPIICWDLLYSKISPKSVHTGASFIAAVTNESQVGDKITTMAHEMQSFTRLRSIESRRSIAKVSLTGYTFFTDPFGRVYGRVPWWSEQISTQQVTLSSAVTLFSRYPGYFPLFCLALVIGLIFILYLPSARTRLLGNKPSFFK